VTETEIIVLAENQTADPSLEGEHGLALLVLAHRRRVLFDTGMSGALVKNAHVMGVADELARIDAIVVSHGHYDHAGGLAAVLELVRRPIPVHVRAGFFAPRLSLRGDAPRAIGVPFDRSSLEARGAQFMEESQGREILSGFWLTGEIPLREEQEAGEVGLMLGTRREHAVADTFSDEHALAVATERGLAVLVGCSHRGLVNSIVAAREAANMSKVAMVLGGAHLRSATPDQITWAIQRCRELAPHLALGHCTGPLAEARFADAYGERFCRLKTGWCWTSTGLLCGGYGCRRRAHAG
jgi:7,8-dihydropterin-6-yl-methyl-4-(beta-D-ribofuranosyl)aminobenzene 5'-phosphate synthase